VKKQRNKVVKDINKIKGMIGSKKTGSISMNKLLYFSIMRQLSYITDSTKEYYQGDYKYYKELQDKYTIIRLRSPLLEILSHHY
jgi:hypothetical protein